MKRGAIVAGFLAGLCAVAFLVMSSGTGALGSGAIGGGGGGNGGTASAVNLTTTGLCTGSFTGLYLEQYGNVTDGKAAIGLCVNGVKAGAITIGPNGGVAQCSHGNVVLGQGSGLALDTSGGCAGDDALNNTFIGAESGVLATTSMQNTFVGSRTGHETTTGRSNTCIGQGCLYENTTGNDSIAMGFHAGLDFAGASNTFLGTRSGEAPLSTHVAQATGTQNACVGTDSCNNFDTATDNVALGFEALKGSGAVKQTGQRNVAIGKRALKLVTSAIDAIAIGRDAGSALTSENGDTIVGSNAGVLLTDTEDALFGWAAGDQMTTSTKTVIVGSLAGHTLTTGDGNTIIGADADVSSSGAANRIVIGRGASGTADNTVQLGNTSIVTVTSTGTYTSAATTATSVTSGTCSSETCSSSTCNAQRGQVTTTCTAGQTTIVTFARTEAATPICTCTPANAAADPVGSGEMFCDASTTALTITAPTAITAGKINYTCFE